MSNSAIFALTINQGTESECHKFGSTWGCRFDCPVFERGECKTVKEDAASFADLLNADELNETQRAAYPELAKIEQELHNLNP